ncbi:hypothetical protein ACTMU2_28295 [Cupriavidus basilensis]
MPGTSDVDDNQQDAVLDADALKARLAGNKAGALTNAADGIDAGLIASPPDPRAVCNMAVGYNNLDIPALTAAGIVATNTPDVLTETTAGFGWALPMATASRDGVSSTTCATAGGSAGATTCWSAWMCMAARSAFSAWGASARHSHAARPGLA